MMTASCTNRRTLARSSLQFGSLYAAPSWRSWKIALSVLDGRPDLLTESDAAFARERLGLDPGAPLPTTPALEAWLVCGRRAGKSAIAALIALAHAVKPYPNLQPGEAPLATFDRQRC